MRRYLNPLLFLVGVILLGWMIMTAGPRHLWQSLETMPLTLVGCISVWAIGYLLNAASWGTLLGRQAVCQIGKVQLYGITVGGYAINYLTPFGLLGGEPYRIVALRRWVGTQAATTSVLLYLTMHVLSHLVLWLSTCFLALFLVPRFEEHLVQALLTIVGVLLAIVVLWFLFRLIPKMRHVLDGYGRDARQLLRHEPLRFYRALAFEYVSRLWNCLEYLLILWALGLDMGFFNALFIVAFSSLVANLLFFSPLQMGTREGGIFLALGLLLPTLPSDQLLSMAVTISLVTRIREFAWIAIGLGCTRFISINKK